MIILLVVIGLSILILVHELGHFLVAKFFGIKVEEFGLGFPPRIFGHKIGETLYSINLLPFGGFVRIYGEGGELPLSDDKRSFAGQPIWKRSATILAGVVMNVLLGWFLLSIIFTIGSPEHLMISEVADDSPAAAIGLKTGDVIIEAKLNEIAFKDPIKSDAFIGFVKDSQGQEMILSVKRGKDILDFAVTGRINPPAGQGSLGVALVEIGFPPSPPFQSIFKGLTSTFNTLRLIAFGFLNFFLKIFVSPEIIESVAGPVGIFLVASQAGSLGIIYLFQLMAIISLNLAVLNLIPFPALDGGRFLFLIIEKIKGSPISKKYEQAINAVGFVFLVVLMILVTIQDIGRITQ